MNMETISSTTQREYLNSHNKKLDTLEIEATPVTNIDMVKSQDYSKPVESNALRYDPEAITALYSKRPLPVWKRRISVLWTFYHLLLACGWTKLQVMPLKMNQNGQLG